MGSVVHVTEPSDLAVIRELFLEYATAVDEPCCFADFERELERLPRGYAALWLAREGGAAAGCVGLRILEPSSAEIKRLYVRAAYRGSGLGRALTQTAIGEARRRRCARVVLDTLPSMQSALALYRSLEFREIPPYLAQPTPGARCFELIL